MRAWRLIALGIILLSGACGSSEAQPAAERRSAKAAQPAPAPVVVELFTSQGCHSCPPADRVLADLGARNAIVPLSFHVDSWNHLGWRDRFSAGRWSERQRAYAGALEGRVYTPQVVVNGRTHVVGTDRAKLDAAIREAAAQPAAADVDIDGYRRGDRFVLTARAELLRDVEAERLELIVVLFERRLSTEVTAGENAGQFLRNDYVVRRLARVADLAGSAGGRATGEISIAVDDDWSGALGAAALLQDPTTRAIHGAARDAL